MLVIVGLVDSEAPPAASYLGRYRRSTLRVLVHEGCFVCRPRLVGLRALIASVSSVLLSHVSVLPKLRVLDFGMKVVCRPCLVGLIPLTASVSSVLLSHVSVLPELRVLDFGMKLLAS